MKNLIIIAGPTASGKTSLAIEVARYFHTEIISADSRQFYREMNIGTAKPTGSEQAEVKHHLIDFLSVKEKYTARDFARDAHLVLEDIFSREKVAVITGGSGLFIKAVTEGFDDIPDVDLTTREELNSLFEEQGIGVLQQKLKNLDPSTYNQIDINNPRRLTRALEVCISSGKPYSFFKTAEKIPVHDYNLVKIAIDWPREDLYNRINSRCDMMLQQDLPGEVKNLLPLKNYRPVQTIGYNEFFEWMEEGVDFETAVKKFKQHTRNYAKRQLTWFRKDKEYQWFHPDDRGKIINYIDSRLL